MSIELGGLSPTITSVSLRACALASDQTAGAVVAAAPAAAVALKNVRRFIEAPLSYPTCRTPPKGRERKERAKGRAHVAADFTPLLVYNHIMTALLDLGLHALRSAYCAGTLDVRQVVEEVLKRIAQSGDDKVWISRVPDAALRAQASKLDARRGDIARLPLCVAPFTVRENIDVLGLATTAACPGFAYQPQKSADVVRRLVAAGAIVVAKANLDQFATGLVGVRSPYGASRNPFDASFIPGGSSSGSAVAVAAGGGGLFLRPA